MKCCECVAREQKSTLKYNGGLSCSSCTEGYYDEEGEWVAPVGRFWSEESWKCSKGHTVRVIKEEGKPETMEHVTR